MEVGIGTRYGKQDVDVDVVKWRAQANASMPASYIPFSNSTPVRATCDHWLDRY